MPVPCAGNVNAIKLALMGLNLAYFFSRLAPKMLFRLLSPYLAHLHTAFLAHIQNSAKKKRAKKGKKSKYVQERAKKELNQPPFSHF